MKSSLIALAVAAALFTAGAPAYADHNSKNGEGWANMPNDIHNTRVDTRQADDNEAFRDFVKYGEGSTSVNRFDTDDTQGKGAAAQKGNTGPAKDKSDAAAMNRNRTTTENAIKDQKRIENRSRLESDAAMQRSNRSATSTRSRASRGARGRH